ncbi:MAG TPA: hypothetical protein VFU43_12695 [Streptosporangiaceae bacterium]|nr:hypothetical protein [Streptosporangiaceae bacterium]
MISLCREIFERRLVASTERPRVAQVHGDGAAPIFGSTISVAMTDVRYQGPTAVVGLVILPITLLVSRLCVAMAVER